MTNDTTKRTRCEAETYDDPEWVQCWNWATRGEYCNEHADHKH